MLLSCVIEYFPDFRIAVENLSLYSKLCGLDFLAFLPAVDLRKLLVYLIQIGMGILLFPEQVFTGVFLRLTPLFFEIRLIDPARHNIEDIFRMAYFSQQQGIKDIERDYFCAVDFLF